MQTHRSLLALLLFIALAASAALLTLPRIRPSDPHSPAAAVQAVAATAEPVPQQTAPTSRATRQPAQQPAQQLSPTSVPPSPTPDRQATPTPRPTGTPPRVGLQIGHLRSEELPDELARLRSNAGTAASGYREVEVNADIAQRVAALLKQQGIVVDLLPATVPPGYDADAFVAIHADGSPGSSPSGYKLATPWRTSPASRHLLEALRAEYGAATGLAWDNRITVNMRGYYAFNYRRHYHAIARTTPAVILEMGYLTNASDRALLTGQPDLLAHGIAQGILRYLAERDPLDGAALIPPEYSIQRPADPSGVAVYAAPSEQAEVLLRAGADARLVPFQERDGWYEVVVRGEWRVIGWVRVDSVRGTGEALPTPTDGS